MVENDQPQTEKARTRKGREEPSMVKRFTGDEGSTILLNVLADTFLFRNVQQLEELTKDCKVCALKKGDILIEQDAADNNLFVVLSGELEIISNGRKHAVRSAGDHVGEMALLDITARRSATVVATIDSVVLDCPNKHFVTFANAHPEIWRKIGIELARRLVQRNRFFIRPRVEPVLFIGCSTEALDTAHSVQESFSHDKWAVEIWTDGIFNASSTAIEDLTSLVRRVDFGLVLLTPDDDIKRRGKTGKQPRDNVIFELGLLIGALGRERTYMLVPRGVDLKVPTDLLGVTPLDFGSGSGSLLSRLGPPCNKLRSIIRALGPL